MFYDKLELKIKGIWVIIIFLICMIALIYTAQFYFIKILHLNGGLTNNEWWIQYYKNESIRYHQLWNQCIGIK